MDARLFIGMALLACSLGANGAPEEKSASAGSSAAAPVEAPPPAAWSHLGYHGGWVAPYDSKPLPVAVRLRHRPAPSDRHAKKPARK